MVNIQRYPEGLLGLLNLANAGAPPQQLLTTVQPTVELAHHYASLTETPFNGSVVSLPTTGSFGTSYVVPGNDVQLLRFITLRLVAASAPFSGLVACVLRRNGGRCYMPFDIPFSFAGGISLPGIGSSFEAHYAPPVPWLLRPGDAFEVETSAVSAGTATAQIFGLAAPLTS